MSEKKKRGRPRNEEKYQNTKRILDNYTLFLQDGNTKHLWDVYDDLKHAVKSIAVKRFKGGTALWGSDKWIWLDTEVERITEEWMISLKKAYDKGKPLEIKSPISCAYFRVLEGWSKSDCFDRDAISYEEYVEHNEFD